MTGPATAAADLLDLLPIGVLVLTADGSIQTCNAPALRFLGIDIIDLLNTRIEDLIKSEALLQGLQAAQQGIEVQHTVLDNERVRISCTIRKYGEGLLLLLEDTTRVRRLDELQREFVQTVLHRLRDPLTTLETTFAIAISDKLCSVPAELKEILCMSRQEVGRLNSLTNDLRDLFLIDTGLIANELEWEICTLGTCVNRAIEILGKMPAPFGPACSRIRIQGEPGIPVRVDFEHFKKIVLHLLKNALAFSPMDTPILVDITEQPNSVKVSITDSGIGISQEALPHVFERFYREDNPTTRKVQGNGLGLYNSRKLTQLMGGVLYCDSQQGKGASFWIVIPKAGGENP